MDARTIIERLGLQPHPEGGFYRETYRSAERVAGPALPGRYGGDRCLATAIYYLLTPETCSRLHRVRSDEIFHFYLGDPACLLQLHPDGSGETVTLGGDVLAGQRLQCVVPAGAWQGAYLQPGGSFALLGTTVAPGFEFEDLEMAGRRDLIRRYPRFAGHIERLGGGAAVTRLRARRRSPRRGP